MTKNPTISVTVLVIILTIAACGVTKPVPVSPVLDVPTVPNMLTLTPPDLPALRLTPPANRPPELPWIEENTDSVFQIDELPDVGHGTGFVISHDGHLLTAYHVVDSPKGQQIAITEADGTLSFYPVTVIAKDKAHDWALVKVEHHFDDPIPLDDEKNVHVGDAVYNIGYPHELGKLVGRGSIMAQNWTRLKYGNTKTDFLNKTICDILDGDGTSGSPIIAEESGKAIGILTNKFREGGGSGWIPAQVIGVVPLSQIIPVLESARVPYLTEHGGPPKTYP